MGERIEERRKVVGISQAELARRVGVRQSTINSLINGESRSSRSIFKIARALLTTPEYLYGELDDPDEGAPVAPAPAIWLQVHLPNEDALTEMFEALLTGIDQAKPLAEQARLLAQSLPTGLSVLRDARPPRPATARASTADPGPPATPHRGSAR
nr:helix-turn-helix domain-containing protein [Sphingomonas jinjuensis]